jgi:hypothetical protein
MPDEGHAESAVEHLRFGTHYNNISCKRERFSAIFSRGMLIGHADEIGGFPPGWCPISSESRCMRAKPPIELSRRRL